MLNDSEIPWLIYEQLNDFAKLSNLVTSPQVLETVFLNVKACFITHGRKWYFSNFLAVFLKQYIILNGKWLLSFSVRHLPLCHLVFLHQCHVIIPLMPVKQITLWISHLPAVRMAISLLVFKTNSISYRAFYKFWWICFSWTFRLLLIKMFLFLISLDEYKY